MMNKLRKNINKRIKAAAALCQEDKLMANNKTQHIDKGLTIDEGSRSLVFHNHTSGKTTISETLKAQKKRKRKKSKCNTFQENFQTKSNPIHSITIMEGNLLRGADSYKANPIHSVSTEPEVDVLPVTDSYKVKKFSTRKHKVQSACINTIG